MQNLLYERGQRSSARCRTRAPAEIHERTRQAPCTLIALRNPRLCSFDGLRSAMAMRIPPHSYVWLRLMLSRDPQVSGKKAED